MHKSLPFLRLIPVLIVLLPTIQTKVFSSFNQRVNHTIHAILNDSDKTLSATQIIEYTNNSPDTLHSLIFHLWANGWKHNQTSFARQMIRRRNYDFHFAREEERGGYQSIVFSQNNTNLRWEKWNGLDDIVILFLETPLNPGEKMTLKNEFTLKFPDARFSRLGYHNDSFYATQWYPKPAVYNSSGWHPMPYLHRGEFFSEFGNYNVFITLPDNYLVASTGILQTKRELALIEKVAMQTISNGPEVADAAEIPPPSSDSLKTIHFRQQNIHDFAWFADKRFRILTSNTTLQTGERVRLYSFFTHDAPKWFKANSYLAESINYMSEKVGPYPWQQVTAVQGIHSGGKDMEYPAITIIGHHDSEREFERVLVHEVFHNWFYGILGSNERDEPWIDEGFTTYYEFRYFEEKYPGDKVAGSFASTTLARYFGFSELQWSHYPYLFYLLKAHQHLDQPPGYTTEKLSGINYFGMAYFKAAMAFSILEEYIGTEVFDSIVQTIFSQWKFRHPTAHDIRIAFSSDDLPSADWFFDDFIYSTRKIDLKMGRIKKSDDAITFTIRNKGDVPVPFTLSVLKNNEELHREWIEGFSGRKKLKIGTTESDQLSIDHDGLLPDLNRLNNSGWVESSPFSKRLPKWQFLGSIRGATRNEIYYLPFMGFNVHDGFMPGIAVYNNVFPVRKNDLFLMPMYSARRDALAGKAWYYRDFYPSGSILHNIRIGTEIKSFGLADGINSRAFLQTTSSGTFVFRASRQEQRTDTYLKLTNFLVQRDKLGYSGNSPVVVAEKHYANRLDFMHDNQSAFNPHKISAEILQADELARTSVTLETLFPMRSNKEGLHLRLFAGTFLQRPKAIDAPDFRFSLQGITPARVALYDEVFIGLQQPAGTIAGNQTFQKHGGFRYPTPLGLTWNWLTAVNLSYDIPRLPARAYFDTGTYHNAGKEIINTSAFPWVGGIQLKLLNDIIHINFPVFASDDLKRIAGLNRLDSYHKRITYSIDFKSIDAFRARRNLHLLLFND